MNVFWIILALTGFLGGQAYLFRCLGKLDRFLEKRPGGMQAFPCDDGGRYPDEDVVE